MPSMNDRVRTATVLLAAIAASSLGGGCRALHSQQVSDESVAAARQLSLQGLDAEQRGRWQRAEALFAEAVARCPRDERARCGYAEALWRRGLGDEAIVHMEEAVRLSGHDPERVVELGRMYRKRGNLARAGEQAERAIAANPQLAAAWALQGEVLQDAGHFNEALASYHRALSYQQPLPEVELAIAEIYRREGRPQRSLATLQALAASYPPNQTPFEVLVQEGFALGALGRHQDAARSLAQACQRGNPSAELLFELAQAQMLAGEPAAARLSVVAALVREPAHPGCLALQRQWGVAGGVVAAVATRPESMR
jgi:tetratricopeptide (TPR) repeat protein